LEFQRELFDNWGTEFLNFLGEKRLSTIRTIAKNTTALFIAEVFSRGVSIFYFAILARYIQVEGVGKISTAQAVVHTLIVLIGFGFNQLIIRDVAAKKERAATYVSNITLIRVALSVVYIILIYFAIRFFNYPNDLSTIIYLYAINAVLTQFASIGLSIFQAFEKMEYNLYARISRDAINIGLSLLAIYLQLSLVVIVSISVFATLLQLMLVLLILRKRFFIPRLEVNPKVCKRLLLTSLPFALVAIYPLARSQLNTLILSVVSSIEEVGWFAAANDLVNMILLIPAILMQALFPVFSRFSELPRNSLEEAYQKSFRYLFILGLAISIGTFLAANEIILLVLGPGFEMAVPALQILAWLPLFAFVGYCNGNFLLAVGKEKLFMLTEGFFAVAYAMLSFILVPRMGFIGACYAVIAPTVIGFVFYSILCHRLLKLKLPLKTGMMATLAAIIMGLLVYYSLQNGINLLAVVFIIGPIVYGLALYLLKVLSLDDILVLKRMLNLT
jgi:O-antigen/teichoic acid export membrane protein